MSLYQSIIKSNRLLAIRAASLGLLLSISIFVPLAGAQQDASAPRQSVKLLHVGNSFSNNAVRHLPALAKAGGKDLTVFGAALGGCTFERHARHLNEAKAGDPKGSPYAVRASLGLKDKSKKTVSLPEALGAQQWDFVTIQQASPFSYKPESFEPYASEVIAEIREKAPQATILIHQTWAYRPDHSLFTREPSLDPEKMYEGIVNAYKQLGERHNLEFLPSGKAVHAATRLPQWQHRKDPNFDYANPTPGVNPQEGGLYGPNRWYTNRRTKKSTFGLDGFHLNSAGEYLAGCVWYEILFNDSVLDVNFTPQGMTDEQAAELRRIAHETVAEYRKNGL